MSTLPAFASAEKVAAAESAGRVEQVGCPLCASNKHQAVRMGRDPLGSHEVFLVVRCDECGLQFTNPRPTAEGIAGYYSTDYLPHSRPARSDRRLRGWYPVDWLQPPQLSSRQARLLDFGCGAGHFLAAMKRTGWEAAGLDMSEAAVEAVRTQGLRALEGTLPHRELEPGTFELVTMWHALEHVHEPVVILREIAKLLSPGGRLVLAVPNAGGWQSRWFGSDWFGLELPRHLTHFTDTTLTKTLEKAGFTVRGLRHSRHADWLRSSAQRARSNGAFSLSAALLRGRTMARLASRLLSNGSWGDAILAWAEPNG